MVMAKGSSCVLPSLTWVEKSAGLQRFRPTWIRTAARQASGIAFSSAPANTTATSSSTPCTRADIRSRPPAATLAPLRTITAVTGRPPRNPETALAVPCASSSRSGGLCRLSGSSRSTACTDSRVSMLATMAMVAPAIQVAVFDSAAKSGLRERQPQRVEAAERHVHEVGRGESQRRRTAERGGKRTRDHDHHQGGRHHRVAAHRGVLPSVQQGERHRGDRQGPGMEVGGDVHQPAVRSERDRQLLQDDRDADRREHALDHRGGNQGGKASGLQHPQQQLQHSGDHHRRQEWTDPAQVLHLDQHDGGQSGGRTGYRQR